MDGTYTATLDRIVDGETAVLLLEENGSVVDQLDIDVDCLPPDGQHEGAVFDLTLEMSSLVDAMYRPEETDRRREEIRDRFDRLSTRIGEDEPDS